ncbi:194_t:CDS:2 [Dentiscutata erythropus]|uniref:194_t:CDS:1 n=1 Tax=Dentiscutata erythropus TaxID=1348616 RepID=A0A9N9EHF7_9GLOM|nr:194_t:CDS:2 [Dentiscutata erythropus]
MFSAEHEFIQQKLQTMLQHGLIALGAKRVLEVFGGNSEQIYQTWKISLHFLDDLTDEDYNNKFLPYTQTSLEFVT